MNHQARRASPLALGNSELMWPMTLEFIPSGTQTFSKAPFQHVNGVSPKYLVKGKGSRVWDPDGNDYIDYMMGLGPAILGHADDEVNDAIMEALSYGVSLSLPHPLETELSRELCGIIPCAEMVRFGKNGSDVTAGAVRAARGYTGRDKIACCGYHGWQDWYIGTTGRYLGVPAAVRNLTLTFEYNNLGSLEDLFHKNPGEIAAVIMEPVTFHPPVQGFLEAVRDLAHSNGSLLVFDEIITGFRMSLGGAQEYFGVKPDLACFGKAMGNGMPISAVVGRREVMSYFDEVFFSFTFGGETASLAAASATLQALWKREAIARIHFLGGRLKAGFDDLVVATGAHELVRMIGFPHWPEYVFSAVGDYEAVELQSLFQQEIVRRGVLTRAGMFISAAHTEEDVDETLVVFREALAVVGEAVAKNKVRQWLEGDVIEKVIRPPRR